MTIKILRSRRRTLALEISADGLVVRAPLWTPKSQIDGFLRKHEKWIRTRCAQIEKSKDRTGAEKLSPEEIEGLKRQAKRLVPQRVAYYAPLVGVDYGRITIRCQRTKWGSCSAKGNLNFNCLLILAPPEVLDSVVVHELCHRKEMNHSKRFYAEVLRVFPDYAKWNRWLKENGQALMSRVQD